MVPADEDRASVKQPNGAVICHACVSRLCGLKCQQKRQLRTSLIRANRVRSSASISEMVCSY